jgi:hypothetical protein
LAYASSRFSPLILSIILLVAGFHTYQLIQQTSGGGDLLYSDIPKNIMILHGQDPYSVQPWSAPYPPLLLLTIAGIIQFTSNNLLQSRPLSELSAKTFAWQDYSPARLFR